MNTKKVIITTACCIACTCLFAVDPDPATSQAIQTSSRKVDDITTLCYTVGAICGMIGGFMAYMKIIDGQTSSIVAIRNWFVACIALLLLPYLARSIVGV